MKVSEYVAHFLNEKGVRFVFGVPGSYIMPVWQQLGSQIHLCSSEADAAYIAAATVRRSRVPAVVLTTIGPGCTNAVSGVASAYRDSLPMLHISGMQSLSQSGTGQFQEESQIDRAFTSGDLMKAITKGCYLLRHAKDITALLDLAWEQMISGRQGPVHISLPLDLQLEECGAAQLPPVRKEAGKSQRDDLLMPSISGAMPLIIAGWGAYLADCETEINTLSCLIHAPILASMKGMSLGSLKMPYFLGALGMGFDSATYDFLEQYQPNLVFVFGCSMGKKDFTDTFHNLLKDAEYYLFSNDPVGASARCKARGVYHTDNLKSTLHQLIEHYKRETDVNGFVTKARIADVWQRRREKNFMTASEDIMAACIRIVCENPEFVITADAGNHFLDAISFYRPKESSHFYIDAGLAAMGNGICTSIGMAFADGTARYVCITGDGCCLMNGNSMALAARAHLPILFVVCNNHCHGRVREGQRAMGKFVASDITGVDFQQFGLSMGIPFSRKAGSVEEFRRELDEYEKRGTETGLIELLVSKNETPVFLKQSAKHIKYHE